MSGDFVVVQDHPSMIAFVDGLQRRNAEALSFYPRQVFERAIKRKAFLRSFGWRGCAAICTSARKAGT